MDTERKIALATELAFNDLHAYAAKLDLPVVPVMGLMYLPSQEVTEQFKIACGAVLRSILTEP